MRVEKQEAKDLLEAGYASGYEAIHLLLFKTNG